MSRVDGSWEELATPEELRRQAQAVRDAGDGSPNAISCYLEAAANRIELLERLIVQPRPVEREIKTHSAAR